MGEATDPRAAPILLVEDNEDIAAVYGEILEMLGRPVLVAQDAARALELVEEVRGRVALVLTDWAMPNMTGTELVRAMRKRGFSPPVIILSGYPAPDGAAEREGVAAWLLKPLEVEELLGTVERVLGEAAAGQ